MEFHVIDETDLRAEVGRTASASSERNTVVREVPFRVVEIYNDLEPMTSGSSHHMRAW